VLVVSDRSLPSIASPHLVAPPTVDDIDDLLSFLGNK
jgi:hypothetical protein